MTPSLPPGPSAPAPCEVRLCRTRQPIASHARMARSFRQRAVGLLTHSRLAPGEALILPDCASIHMVGMRFAIDAIFVDRRWRVVAVRQGLKPGRFVLPIRGAWGVIEAGEGTIAQAGLRVGDQLELIGAP